MILVIAGMYVAGIAMQRISLATLIISLGLLVDNGIVVSEEIGQRLFRGEGRMDAAVNTGKKLAIPLLISSITTVLMFVPLALAPHSSGEYLRSMSMVIMMTLGLSWLLAMTVTPILCHRFLKPPEVSEEELQQQFETPMYRAYRSLLERAMAHRTPILAAMVGVFIAGIALLSVVPQQFFPESDRPQILVDIKLPAGYGIRETKRQVERLVAWLEDEEQNPEILQTLTYVGNGGVRFFVTIAPEASAENVAAIVISLPDPSEVGPVMDRLRNHALEQFPELSLRAKRMFLGSVETGLIEARLFGPDRDALFAAGKTVENRLAEISGTINVYNDWENRVIHAVVEVDQNQARRSGVTSRDIASSLTTALRGDEFSVLREGDEEISITARVVATERLSADRVRGLNVVSAKTGKIVPLMQISTIQPRNEPFVIKRRDHSPTVTIEAKSLTLTAPELEAELRPTLDGIVAELGQDYRWEYGGETESSGDAQTALFAFVPICFLGILICLVGQFNSFKKPIVIILTIPLALTGVSIGLLISGSFFGFMAILGILSLIGIVINNAIVLLDQIDIEQASGKSPYDAIVAASLGRFRPILMTTLTTVLGMLPIIISRDPLFYPMANTIAYGLAFGTVLTLGVAPVLYAVLFRVESPT
jgi:multidrug efflux pump subunit AcrB